MVTTVIRRKYCVTYTATCWDIYNLYGVSRYGMVNNTNLHEGKKTPLYKKSTSYLGTFFVGLGFAAGWTPCIGPIFASILLLAATNPSHGLLYTFMYVIGFAVPFIVLTFFIGSSKWIVGKTGIIMKVGGIMMVLMGILLFFGLMPRLSAFLLRLIDGTWLSNLG